MPNYSKAPGLKIPAAINRQEDTGNISSREVVGGRMAVNSIAERDNIPATSPMGNGIGFGYREPNMEVFVRDIGDGTSATYRLEVGDYTSLTSSQLQTALADNSNWRKLTSGEEAQAAADAAQTAADQAQTAANNAQTSADASQSKADQAVNDAAAAQADADQGINDAAAAQTTANQAVSDAATAQTAANNAQTAANAAQTAADNAQADADQGINDASIAQSTANQAVNDAAAAQTAADQAQTAANNAQASADAAQTAADQAQTAADSAQTTADQAVNDAATAQTAADNAQADADQGINDAAAAQADATKGINDAAAAQSTANQADNKADQNAQDIANNASSISTIQTNQQADGITINDLLSRVDAIENQLASQQTGATCTLSTPENPTQNSPIIISAQFSEDVVGFGIGDFSLVSGSGVFGNFTAINARNYSVEFTPSNDGTIEIIVPAGVANSAGGATQPSNTLSINYSTPPVRLIHILGYGQSQMEGFNAQPALTTGSDNDAITLSGGNNAQGVDVVSGNFVSMAEQDVGQLGETIATSMAIQLLEYINDANTKVCVTLHAQGGTSLQDLSKGGASGKYEEGIDAVSRVKALADANGWSYENHMIWFHGGSGVNPYETDLRQLLSDYRADVGVITSQSIPIYAFSDQQRPIGNPDYGVQSFNVFNDPAEPNNVFIGSRYTADYTGDQIHLTNHGTRYMAMLFARAIYDEIYGGGFAPFVITDLILDEPNVRIVYAGNNGVGGVIGSGDFGMEVYELPTNTRVPGTFQQGAGNYILFTPDSPPTVQVNWEVRSKQGGVGFLYYDSADTTIFTDNNNQAYLLDKYLPRQAVDKNLSFTPNATPVSNIGVTSNNPTTATTGGTVIGQITASGDNPKTYTLVSGTGDEDNAKVSVDINGEVTAASDLTVAETLNFRVEVDNDANSPVQAALTLNVVAAATGKTASGRILQNWGDNTDLPAEPDANGNYWNNAVGDAATGGAGNGFLAGQVFVIDQDSGGNPINGNNIELEIIERFSSFGTGDGINDTGQFVDVGDYPAECVSSSAFTYTETPSFRFNNLDPNKTYSFKFWGNRDAATGRVTEIRQIAPATTAWFEYDAGRNNDFNEAVVISGLTGSSSYTFEFRRKQGNAFGYIGLVDIEES